MKDVRKRPRRLYSSINKQNSNENYSAKKNTHYIKQQMFLKCKIQKQELDYKNGV